MPSSSSLIRRLAFAGLLTLMLGGCDELFEDEAAQDDPSGQSFTRQEVQELKALAAQGDRAALKRKFKEDPRLQNMLEDWQQDHPGVLELPSPGAPLPDPDVYMPPGGQGQGGF